MADNIEVLALGTIVFYEIEIHARDDHPTAIQTTKNHGQGIGGSCYFDGE